MTIIHPLEMFSFSLDDVSAQLCNNQIEIYLKTKLAKIDMISFRFER